MTGEGVVPRISVVMPTFCGERFVGPAVESVLAQTRPDWELVVVDDGSADSTPDIIAGYAAQDGRIRLVRQGNRGVAEARNRGLAEARPESEYVVFLDHDDVWEPDALEALAGVLDRQEGPVAAHGLARFIDTEGRPKDPGDLERWGRRRVGLAGERSVAWPIDAPTTFPVMVFRCPISTPGQVLIRRRALAEVGPFDPETVPTDDWDMWLRLTRRGDFAFVNRVVIGWRQHDRNESRHRRRKHRVGIHTFQKLARSPDLTAEERRLLRLVDRWQWWESSRSRLEWARGALAHGDLLAALKQLRHAAIGLYMFYRRRG